VPNRTQRREYHFAGGFGRFQAALHYQSNLPKKSSTTGSNGFFRKELTDDGLLPNRAGYAIMEPLLDAAIAKSLRIGVSAEQLLISPTYCNW
jgi:hypothetical protein